MRVAVVGHVEWVRFAARRAASRAGRDHARVGRRGRSRPAAARSRPVQLRNLAGEADFFVALGNDELGRRRVRALELRGFRLHAATRDEPQRRAFTFVDERGERTITVIGDRLVSARRDPLPWDELAAIDGSTSRAGDLGRASSRSAGARLVATARELPTLLEAHVQLDALVGSARDPGETYEPGQLDPPPSLIVSTRGREGGTMTPGGRSGRSRRRLPGPSWTRTAPATRSRPGSHLRLRAETRPRKRSPSPPNAERRR